ncbi:glycoside hydrolase family 95-like protein [Bacteroidota bacterium]
MKNFGNLIILGLVVVLFSFCEKPVALDSYKNNLIFEKLSDRWDEAIPLGNGMLGNLVWQNEGKLRFSLDRADLWDLRPMKNLDSPKWKFKWVYNQWLKNDYAPVQNQFDNPYNQQPAPSKIPAAALEFDISRLGEVESVELHVNTAVCEVKWKNGAKLTAFIHATEPVGWYRFEGIGETIEAELIKPAYNIEGDKETVDSHSGPDLRRLAYPPGEINKLGNSMKYDQEGWGGFKYQVSVRWREGKNIQEGCWSISSEFQGWEKSIKAESITGTKMKEGFTRQLKRHISWWNNFWSKSNISLPDTVLEKQWYLEQYKFGAAARKGAPPISLQAVWTADNGKLPPWKGDFHHDLNTQLSYWPAYSGNHLDLEEGFIDWLWKYRNTFKNYTKEYYETNGLNVPGVTTLTGDPMGGWIQYSFGPTVSAWLAHHFYLHWRYSMDRTFLKEKAYPWIKDVAIHLDEISVTGKDGKRKLPISSSPEIFDNSAKAWFINTTNFDLTLISWTFEKAAELALELGYTEEASKWSKILNEWPGQTIDEDSGLMFAPGFPYESSHRHFSHLMAYHPFGLIDWSNGPEDQKIIKNTINRLEEIGTDWWTGYSFSWMGNLYARAFNGDKAAEVLKTFATCFCLPNSFHVNGDQSGTGKSKFTYRPFTLEGNFAYAAGIQEMLIQSHTGIVRIFPAIPENWENVSFNNLRTEGAFLVSAKKENGEVTEIKVYSEKGGLFKIRIPFSTNFTSNRENIKPDDIVKDDIIVFELPAGEEVVLRSGV